MRTILALCLSVILLGCAEEDHVGKRPDAAAPVLTVSQALDPMQFGRSIRVQGRVSEVCQEEGCWMTITDGSAFLRMSFKDEAFYVPMELHGEVIVEGTIREEVFEQESARALASTIGRSHDEIDAMLGDQRLPIMTSTGVLFLN
jgi:hypothetical protein